jgi:hypothetical protein
MNNVGVSVPLVLHPKNSSVSSVSSVVKELCLAVTTSAQITHSHAPSLKQFAE